MYKLKQTVLMLCFILSGALCYASSVAEQENEKGEDGISTVLCGKHSQTGKLIIVK
jgi:hypothetical protein